MKGTERRGGRRGGESAGSRRKEEEVRGRGTDFANNEVCSII